MTKTATGIFVLPPLPNQSGRKPQKLELQAGRHFRTEKELQMWLVDYIKQSKPSYRLRGGSYEPFPVAGKSNFSVAELDTEIKIPNGGRVDILFKDELLVECKLHLYISSIAQAIGQIWLYHRYFPKCRPVIAGTLSKNEKLQPSLERAVLECGLSLWIVKTNEKGC